MKAVHRMVHLVKFIGKYVAQFFFLSANVMRYLQYYRIWYLPGCITTEQTSTISGLCLCWRAFQLRNSATGLQEAQTNWSSS